MYKTLVQVFCARSASKKKKNHCFIYFKSNPVGTVVLRVVEQCKLIQIIFFLPEMFVELRKQNWQRNIIHHLRTERSHTAFENKSYSKQGKIDSIRYCINLPYLEPNDFSCSHV